VTELGTFCTRRAVTPLSRPEYSAVTSVYQGSSCWPCARRQAPSSSVCGPQGAQDELRDDERSGQDGVCGLTGGDGLATGPKQQGCCGSDKHTRHDSQHG